MALARALARARALAGARVLAGLAKDLAEVLASSAVLISLASLAEYYHHRLRRLIWGSKHHKGKALALTFFILWCELVRPYKASHIKGLQRVWKIWMERIPKLKWPRFPEYCRNLVRN